MTDTDLEYADRAVVQMQRCLEAARADVAALTSLVSDVEAALCDAVDSGICAPPIDDWREWAETLLVKVRNREYIPSLALADMQAPVARLMREVQEMAARVDEMRAERDRIRLLWDALNAERDVWYARADRAEAERDGLAMTEGSRRSEARAGGRDPGVPLPVVPTNCGMCEHSRDDDRCTHPSYPADRFRYVDGLAFPPPGWCPLRSEFAKAAP